MATQPSPPFDIAATLNMYAEFIELWKRNYENFLKSAPLVAGSMDKKKTAVESITSPNDTALLNWQESADEIFKRFVQNQMALCHFFGHRWEQYLNLSKQLSQCRSLSELGNLQSSFLSQFANDYMQETEKLATPVADLARQVAPLVPPHR